MPSKQLVLDNLEEETLEVTSKEIGYVNRAMADGVENEKCIVTQYRSTKEQVEIFKKHVKNNPPNQKSKYK